MQEKEQKISPIKQRILLFADSLGISKREFYSKIDVSRGTLESKTGITEDIVAKFIATFPDISPEWLLTGKGNMLRKHAIPVLEEFGEDITKQASGIPLVPIEVVAGWNGVDAPGVSIIDCEHYHIPDFMAAGAEYLIRVSGSSMYPKYSSGDILACKKIHEITFFQWGKIYVIDSAQGAMVKRLFECTTNTDNIICKSDNEKYPPFELPKSEIRSLSIVIGVVRLE